MYRWFPQFYQTFFTIQRAAGVLFLIIPSVNFNPEFHVFYQIIGLGHARS